MKQQIEIKMKPHQERVVKERIELDQKIKNLSEFITGDFFSQLDAAEQGRLHRQLSIMTAYSNILGERVDAFS